MKFLVDSRHGLNLFSNEDPSQLEAYLMNLNAEHGDTRFTVWRLNDEPKTYELKPVIVIQVPK